jgi:hypothetical protein
MLIDITMFRPDGSPQTTRLGTDWFVDNSPEVRAVVERRIRGLLRDLADERQTGITSETGFFLDREGTR